MCRQAGGFPHFMKDRRVLTLFFVLWIVMVGFGIIIPIMPFYVLHFGANSLALGVLMATFSVTQFLFAPFWGQLSDRIGRRPVLLVGLGGYVISFLIMAAANGMEMLFLARVVAGALSSATLPTAMAFVSDTTSHEDRGSGMGLLGAAMGLGMIFGPALGGYLSQFGITAPFYFSAALASVVFVFAFLTLPETLAQKGRSTARTASPAAQVRLLAGAMRGRLAVYFLVSFIVSFGMANLEGVFAFFAADKLGYGPAEVGIVFVVMGIMGVLVQGVAIGPLVSRFGEERLMQAGLLVGGLGMFLVIQAFDMPSLVAFVTLQGLGLTVLRPATTSLLSKRATAGQGTTMGLLGSFDSLGRMIGPVWGGFTYQFAIAAPFVTAGLVLLLALAVLLLAAPPVTQPVESA
ncbi:MAG: MFS transporter [Chloroflexota bacterium]